jgi:hypothetical protein
LYRQHHLHRLALLHRRRHRLLMLLSLYQHHRYHQKEKRLHN